jgi:hypothetical protein
LPVVLLRGREEGEHSTIWVKEEDYGRRREILTQLNTVFCTSITATLSGDKETFSMVLPR